MLKTEENRGDLRINFKIFKEIVKLVYLVSKLLS